MALQDAGKATIAYFYFDIKNTNKQDFRNAIASLLTQLSTYSDRYCDILSHIHYPRYHAEYHPSTETMVKCFKKMLALPDQGPVYIILDALDECYNAPYARKGALDCLKDLIDLQLPNIHICVTSRLEFYVRTMLEPLASHSISIHDQNGQKKDLEDYIRSFVNPGSGRLMRRWGEKDKELVINTLGDRADGM